MPRFRFGTARDFCSVGGMTTTFVSMTHDVTLGHEPRSENSFASFPAYALINYKRFSHLRGIVRLGKFRNLFKSIRSDFYFPPALNCNGVTGTPSLQTPMLT